MLKPIKKIWRKYKWSLDAQEAFDALRIGDCDIDDIHLKTTDVYDSVFRWYQGASRRRWLLSVIIRWAAVAIGGIGTIILELAAFEPNKAAAENAVNNLFGFVGITPAAMSPATVATMLMLIAGLILLTDRVLMINLKGLS